jgi:DNA-binding CsgD family transcriptional regulator
MGGVFVGREPELELIGRALAGGPGAVFVVGDPGSGKSRLASEALRRIGADTVVAIVGYEPERLVPLAAASDLLRELVPAFASAEVDAQGLEPIRLFEAAHRAVRERAPVLFAVDDVQWADDLSLALVHYLVRASVRAGDVRLLCATRPDQRARRFADDVTRLFGPDDVVEIGLTGLERADGVRLATELDPRLDDIRAREIWERAAGLPFWIEALARAGGEPVDAARLLTSRMRGAGPDASELLALLAVVARPLPEDSACALLGWPEGRLRSAADDLLVHGIVRLVGGTVGLAHDLLRDAAADGVPEPRRRALHRGIARWLEAAAGGDVAALREALEHRIASGEPALDLARALASSAQRRRLGRDGLLELAAIADEAPADDALHELVGELAQELGEHALSVQRWSDLALRVTDPGRRAAAFLQASRSAFELGPALPGRARVLLERVDRATSDVLDVRARALEARILLWLEHRTPDGAAVAREAVERSDRLGDGQDARRARFKALRAAYEAAMQEDRGEEMLALAQRLLEESATYAARVDALISRGLAQRFARPASEAIASFEAARELAAHHILPTQGVDAGFWLAQSLHDRGLVLEAERVAREAQELADRVGDVSRVRAHVRRVADLVALTRGRREEGLYGLAADAESEPDPHYRIGSREVAMLFLARADGEAAASAVQSLVELARADATASGCPRCTNEFQVHAVEALARAGCVDAAVAELGRVEASVPPAPVPLLFRLRAEGALAVARGSSDAVERLERARAAAVAVERELDELWIRFDLGRALVPTDRKRAADELRSVASRADELDAVTVREVSSRELRRLGVRTWRRGRGSADGTLSEREREVATLVAGGASNPEIAQALFLSRKTVERHVSNVLAKSGVRNRAELAALLAREGEGVPR